MSQKQAEGALITVGNILIGRSWKAHNQADCIDLDTLPAPCNIHEVGKRFELLALGGIVKKMMFSGEEKKFSHCLFRK